MKAALSLHLDRRKPGRNTLQSCLHNKKELHSPIDIDFNAFIRHIGTDGCNFVFCYRTKSCGGAPKCITGIAVALIETIPNTPIGLSFHLINPKNLAEIETERQPVTLTVAPPGRTHRRIIDNGVHIGNGDLYPHPRGAITHIGQRIYRGLQVIFNGLQIRAPDITFGRFHPPLIIAIRPAADYFLYPRENLILVDGAQEFQHHRMGPL